MDYYDKESVVGETERCDTPAALDAEDTHQPRSPVKLSTQTESQQSSSAKKFPLGSAPAPSSGHAKGSNNINLTNLPSTPIKIQRSRPSSPVKTPGSRPPSRPSSPLKRTPAPGKNEHFETTPTSFRYTIELPESKIVPKKDSGATPSKSKTSTPGKKFALADAPSKQNSPKRGSSPAKSANPRKELLRTRAASPEKHGTANGVNGAEPTPAYATPRSHKKRNSVRLTKTNGVHAGTPTVEVTKEDVWIGVQLKSPWTSEGGGVGAQAKENDSHEGERGTGVDGPSPSPASMEFPQESNVMGVEAIAVLPKKQLVATNFGEMLRYSSRTIVQISSSSFDEAPEKTFASPTVLDKARRNSEMHPQSLVGVIAKPKFKSSSLTKQAIAPVTKGSTNGALDGVSKHSAEQPEAQKNSTRRRVSFASIPRTPTGTPPAIMAAIEADMNDIRSSLRRSLGNGYTAAPISPAITRWQGSSTNGISPPDLPLATDATNVGNTPRFNLKERMAAAKQSILTKPSPRSKQAAPAPLTLRSADKAGAQSPSHSRLPRPSPTKLKPPLRSPGTIPQAPRTSPFDVDMTPTRVPAMASHRARYARASEKKGETVGFASAEDIAKQVEEWNSVPTEKEPSVQASGEAVAKTPVKTTRDRLKGGLGFMRSTATSAKKEKPKPNETEQESYTPPGSPSVPQPKSKPSAHQAKKQISPFKNPKIRALATAAPRTPLPRGKGGLKALDRGAVRTPSKEMVGKLDKQIDAHLENEARAGRVFTPSGQRISDLLAKRRESEGQ
ncbi:hypothetical protein P171DRAFT_525368 [Karstenula rhodostoma CBS 690.94]|uniref:Uncharacterized protein n=1 Tax=Karstenula rhodostoma CBS 690.94 TaxID=1392251 RepID=A0A9P4PA87_9PLEO|nr:hypothetical protein P171DRAFT_525368 [Karstenula rhodostoma CBS 690.94]